MTFQTKVDKARTDERGGTLRLTGKIRRNIVYTTNGTILQNTIEPYRQDLQKVNLLLESPDGCSMMLNITPRLGFQRHIPEAENVIQRRPDAGMHGLPPRLRLQISTRTSIILHGG